MKVFLSQLTVVREFELFSSQRLADNITLWNDPHAASIHDVSATEGKSRVTVSISCHVKPIQQPATSCCHVKWCHAACYVKITIKLPQRFLDGWVSSWKHVKTPVFWHSKHAAVTKIKRMFGLFYALKMWISSIFQPKHRYELFHPRSADFFFLFSLWHSSFSWFQLLLI